MTKSELIAEIANRTGLAKTDVEKSLKAFEDVAHEIVAKGEEKLTLPGLPARLEIQKPFPTRERPQNAGFLRTISGYALTKSR